MAEFECLLADCHINSRGGRVESESGGRLCYAVKPT